MLPNLGVTVDVAVVGVTAGVMLGVALFVYRILENLKVFKNEKNSIRIFYNKYVCINPHNFSPNFSTVGHMFKLQKFQLCLRRNNCRDNP